MLSTRYQQTRLVFDRRDRNIVKYGKYSGHVFLMKLFTISNTWIKVYFNLRNCDSLIITLYSKSIHQLRED